MKDPFADENAPDRIAAVGVFDKVRIEPKVIVELADLEDLPEDSEPLPPDAVKGIKLKMQTLKKFVSIWDTTKTRAQKPLSIWQASHDTGVFKKNNVRVSFGHFAVDDIKQPDKAKRLKKTPPEIIEVSDTGSGHRTVVDEVRRVQHDALCFALIFRSGTFCSIFIDPIGRWSIGCSSPLSVPAEVSFGVESSSKQEAYVCVERCPTV